MSVITSVQRLVEEIPSADGGPPNQDQWISEPGGLSPETGALTFPR